MSVSKLLARAGQVSFKFGSLGDDTYRHSTPKGEVVVMTPKLAAYLLQSADPEGMAGPRFLGNVRTYKRSMLGHTWRLNGDSIVVDSNGRVIDGRARLKACVESRVPFPVVLFTGVPPNAEYTLDMRSVRSKADTLFVKGVAQPGIVSKACEVIHRFLNDPDRRTFVANRPSAQPLDNSAVKLMTELYPQIELSACLVENVEMPGFSRTALTVAHFLMGLVDTTEADRFMSVLADPKSDPSGIPGRLSKKAKATRKGLTGGKDTLALAILGKCWEAHLDHEPFHSSMTAYAGRIEGDDSGREGFPAFRVTPDERIVLDVGANLSVLAAVNPFSLHSAMEARIAKSGVTAEVVEVDPAVAKAFLAVNGPNGDRNRKIRRHQVEYLKVEIQGRRWVLNGQGIKVSKGGFMLDGQHRCTAVVETGIAIQSLVVRGLSDDVFSTFDGGQRNSYARLTNNKETYANERGAALRVVGMILQDDESARITPSLQREMEDDFPHLGQAVLVAKESADILSAAVGGALFAVFAKIDENAAFAFFKSLADGIDLDDGMPVYTLREKLLKDGRDKSDKTHAKHARWVIQAWNSTINGRTLMQIRNVKGPRFPQISSG